MPEEFRPPMPAPLLPQGTSQPFKSSDIPVKPPDPPAPPVGLTLDCRDVRTVRIIKRFPHDHKGEPQVTVLAQLSIGDVMELLRIKMERQLQEAEGRRAQAQCVIDSLDAHDEDGSLKEDG